VSCWHRRRAKVEGGGHSSGTLGAGGGLQLVADDWLPADFSLVNQRAAMFEGNCGVDKAVGTYVRAVSLTSDVRFRKRQAYQFPVCFDPAYRLLD